VLGLLSTAAKDKRVAAFKTANLLARLSVLDQVAGSDAEDPATADADRHIDGSFTTNLLDRVGSAAFVAGGRRS